MRGTILNTPRNSEPGLVTGDDGNRYAYSDDQWRGQQAASPGQRVDFETQGDEAVALYPDLSAGAQLRSRLQDVARSPFGLRATEIMTHTTEAPLATLVLIAGFLTVLTLVPAGFGAMPAMDYSLYGAGGALVEQLQQLDHYINPLAARPSTEEKGAFQATLALRWLAPIGALAVLWAAWRGHSRRWLTALTGVVALLTVLQLYGLASGIEKGFEGELRMEMGVGAWLLAIAGAGLLASASGKLRNPLAAA